MTIVDVHCHTFNADDLPVRGFVRRVAGQRNSLAVVLASALDRIIQDRAVDAAEERRRLDALLAAPPGGLEADVDPLAGLGHYADSLVDELAAERPGEVAQAQTEIETTTPGTAGGEEGLVERFEDVKRYVRWAALFGASRLDLTLALQTTYPEVDLFTPLLVDLRGLDDHPVTSISDQLELNERISLLSMRGDLAASVHPFAGYDPRNPDGLDLLRRAVTEFACVGVKLYPPMGFRPIDNAVDPPHGMDADAARTVDRNLQELFSWCALEQIPVTAHSNPSNHAHASFEEFSHPDLWRRVLTQHPKLRLNLGHFGWGGRDRGWPDEICRMANDFEHLYADIGNHHVEELDESFTSVRALFEAPETEAMRDRLMFGTDWFMVAAHRRSDEFLTATREAYERLLGTPAADFMGGNALRFLGFADPTNANARRLAQRYADHELAPPAWLARPAPADVETIVATQPVASRPTPTTTDKRSPDMTDADVDLVPVIAADRLPRWGIGFGATGAVLVAALLWISKAAGLFDSAAEQGGTHALANTISVWLALIGVALAFVGAFLVLADLKRPAVRATSSAVGGDEALISSATGVAAVGAMVKGLVEGIGTSLSKLRGPGSVLLVAAVCLTTSALVAWQTLPGADGSPTVSVDQPSPSTTVASGSTTSTTP